MSQEYNYEIQFLDKNGEPISHDAAKTLQEAKSKALQGLAKSMSPYELRYAEVIDMCTRKGATLHAYRTTLSHVVEIPLDEVPLW